MGEDSYFPTVSLDIGFLRELTVAERTKVDEEILNAAARDDQTSVLNDREADTIPLHWATTNEEQWSLIVQYLYRRHLFTTLNLKWPFEKPLDKGFSDFFYRLPATDVSPNNARIFVEAAVSFSNRDPQCPRGLCLPNFFRVLSDDPDDIRLMMIQHWFAMLESERSPSLEMRLNAITWLTAVANENYFTDLILETFVKLADQKPTMRRTLELALEGIDGVENRPGRLLKRLKNLYPDNQWEMVTLEAIVLVLKASEGEKNWPDLVPELKALSPENEMGKEAAEVIRSALKDKDIDKIKSWPDLVVKLIENLPLGNREEEIRKSIVLALKDIEGIKARPDLALKLVKFLSPNNELGEDVREAVVAFFGALLREMAVDRLAPIWNNWGKMDEPKLVTLIQECHDKEKSEKVRKKAAEVLEAFKRAKNKS